MVKVSVGCRRLVAGEAERGGESGFVHSGDQKSRGGHLRVAGSKMQLLVALVELGVAGNGAGDDFGGRRSSGEVELEATEHGEARGVVLRGSCGCGECVGHDGVASGWPESRRRRAPRRCVRVSFVQSLRGSGARKEGGRGSWAHGDLEEPDGAVGDELVRR